MEQSNKETLNKFLHQNLNELEINNLPNFPTRTSLSLHKNLKLILFSNYDKIFIENTTRANLNRKFPKNNYLNFPQIFSIENKLIYNQLTKTLEQISSLFTKYSFNFDNNIDLDIGCECTMRNNYGYTNLFTTIKFNSLNNNLINFFTFGFGKKKYFIFNSNYFINDYLSINYRINKSDSYEFNKIKNKLEVITPINNNILITNGINYWNLFNSPYLYSNIEYYFNKKKENKIRTKIKLGGKNKFDFEFKHKISENFFTKFSYDINLNDLYLTNIKNDLIFKINSTHNINIGYFINYDGLGINLSYSTSGISISFPIIFYKICYNINFSLSDHLKKLFFHSICFLFGNILITVLKKYIKRVKKKYFNNDSSKNEEEIKIMLKKRIYQENLISQIKNESDLKHKKELNNTNNNGLIIIFAYYGNSKTIKKIIEINNENTSESEKNENINNIIENISNEVIDVTIPVRYLIVKDEDSTYSKIFFDLVPKTSFVGFINPIYKNNKKPKLLIKYSINNKIFIQIIKDYEYYQIPNKIN